MLNFTKKMIVTGAEQRVKKDGNSYVLVHVLGNNGQTFSCIYKGDVNKVMTLEKMQQYNIDFSVSIGQYTHISIVDINK